VTGAWRGCLAGAASLLLGGCYYAHVAGGQASLLLHRQPMARIVADVHADPRLQGRLALAMRARAFASSTLALPRNRSYTGYVALARPYVAWNVFATPPYSVAAVTHCFPFAGCVAYRGYFAESKARAEAARLRRQGLDVSVGGVPAYSTLGWFDDPVLSSMLRWDDDELAGTIFHELAHQRVYAKGDTSFNESYASFVQRQGLLAWRQSRGLPPGDDRDERMDQAFTTLVLDLRARLAARYALGGAPAALADAKRALIDDFRRRYAHWRDADWAADRRYDAWVAGDINNASLLPFGLYERWVPAFASVFAQCHGDWAAFHARVAELARLPIAEREQRLQALLALAPQASAG
jgi:predicted aminopeptidase